MTEAQHLILWPFKKDAKVGWWQILRGTVMKQEQRHSSSIKEKYLSSKSALKVWYVSAWEKVSCHSTESRLATHVQAKHAKQKHHGLTLQLPRKSGILIRSRSSVYQSLFLYNFHTFVVSKMTHYTYTMHNVLYILVYELYKVIFSSESNRPSTSGTQGNLWQVSV